MADVKERIARRCAKELKNGDFVNLGIGLPTMVANYLPEGVDVTLHSENGFAGLGVAAENAAKTQKTIGQYIVKHTHQDRIEDHGAVAEIAGLESGSDHIGTQSHLHQGIAEAGSQTPFYTMAVGDHHDGQHGTEG